MATGGIDHRYSPSASFHRYHLVGIFNYSLPVESRIGFYTIPNIELLLRSVELIFLGQPLALDSENFVNMTDFQFYMTFVLGFVVMLTTLIFTGIKVQRGVIQSAAGFVMLGYNKAFMIFIKLLEGICGIGVLFRKTTFFAALLLSVAILILHFQGMKVFVSGGTKPGLK